MINIVLYQLSREEKELYNLFSRGYTSIITPSSHRYKVRLEENGKILYRFKETFLYDGKEFYSWGDKSRIEEKLKEYDNPETEIIFDNSENDD